MAEEISQAWRPLSAPPEITTDRVRLTESPGAKTLLDLLFKAQDPPHLDSSQNLPMRRRALPKSFFTPMVAQIVTGGSSKVSLPAADEAQTRKQSRSKQRRSKSTSSESKSGSFKPITELDESRMKAPQTPQSSKRPRPSRTSFPVKPKKRRPSDIALLAGSSTAKHIPSLDKKLQAIYPGEYRPHAHGIGDYTSGLHSRSLSEPSLSNPDELPQHLHTSFMDDDLDTAGWREYRSSLSNSTPASPSTMPFDGFLSPTFDVASSELESMMPSHDTFLSESHSARYKPVDGQRLRPDSCPELSVGFSGLRTYSPIIPEGLDEPDSLLLNAPQSISPLGPEPSWSGQDQFGHIPM